MIEEKKSNIVMQSIIKLKSAIFKMTSQMLENNLINLPMYVIALLFETIQICAYFLSVGLRVADNNADGVELYGGLIDFLYSATLKSLATGVSFNANAGCEIGIFLFYVLVVFAMIYYETVNLKNNAGREYELVACVFKTLSIALMFIFMIVALPLLLLHLSVFRCVMVNGQMVYEAQKDTVCWDALHFVVCVLSCINMLAFSTFTIIFDTLLTDSSPRSTIPWACTAANKIRVFKYVAKFVLACFAVFDPAADYYHYLYATQGIMYILIIYIIFTSPGFINRISGYIVLFVNTAIFFLMVLTYIMRVSDLQAQVETAVVAIALLVLICCLIVFVQAMYDDSVLNIQVAEARSENLKEYYFYELFKLLDLYSLGDSRVSIKLYGLYSNHQTYCHNPTCGCCGGPLNQNLESALRSENTNRCQAEMLREAETSSGGVHSSRVNLAMLFQMNETLQEFGLSEERDRSSGEDENAPVRKPTNYKLAVDMCTSMIDYEVTNNPASVTLRMISAYFAKEYLGNVFKAIHDLEYIEEKQKPSIRERFQIYKYKSCIEEEIAGYSRKRAGNRDLNVEPLLEFEKSYTTFRSQAETASNIVNRFWEQLKSKDLDVNGLYEIGSKVGILYAEMQRNFNVAISIFPGNYKLLQEFGNFELNIMNNDLIARNYEQRAAQLLKEQAEQNRDLTRVGMSLINIQAVQSASVCVISGSPNNIGDILSVNHEIRNLLGFNSKEIIGQNTAVLCPSYIGTLHNSFLEGFMRRGKSEMIGSQCEVVAADKKGFLVPLRAVIQIFPSISEGVRFVGVFLPKEDYTDIFGERWHHFNTSDLAVIATSPEGEILGINETCTARLGMPVAAFRRQNVQDKILLSAMMKELSDPNIEAELLGEGRKLVIDTKQFLLSINSENLSRREARNMERKAGRYIVFVHLQNEKYAEGALRIKLYKMIVVGDEMTSTENVLECMGSAKGSATPGSETGKTPQKSSNRLCIKIPSDDRVCNNARMLSEVQSPTHKANQRALSDFKQIINSRSAAINVSAIKYGVNILCILVIGLASVNFAYLLIDARWYQDSMETIFVSNRRVMDVGAIHSIIYTMVNMTNTTGYRTSQYGIDIYSYWQEYGTNAVGVLGVHQDYLNTLDFSYSAKLRTMEKTSSVCTVTLGQNNQQTEIYQTINTAVTQYSSKATNFLSYEPAALAAQLSTQTMKEAFFYVRENGLRSLSISAQGSETEFLALIQSRIGDMLWYYIGATIIAVGSLVISFIIMIIKLIGIQRKKINVLLVYAQLNRREIAALIDKCTEYQKSIGLWDYDPDTDEDVAPRSSDNAVGGSTPYDLFTPGSKSRSQPYTEERKVGTNPDKYNLTELMKVTEKEKKIDQAESDSEEDESLDESEEKTEDKRKQEEEERTIQEQLDPVQLRSKLTTSKFSLITISIFVCLLSSSFFIVNTVKTLFDMDDAKFAMKAMDGVSQMIKTQLFLVLYAMVSAKENRTIYLNGSDSIDVYMEDFLNANSFSQTLKASSVGLVQNLKDIFETVDSSSLCGELQSMYSLIRSTYPETSDGKYNYTRQRNLSESICNSYLDGMMAKGTTQVAFIIQQEVQSLQTARKAGKSTDLTGVAESIHTLQLFIEPLYEGLMLTLRKDANSTWNSLKTFLIAFFVCYTISSLIVNIMFWSCFLKVLESELVKSRGMLRILPLELIDKLKKMKKGLIKSENTQNLKYFKGIEKI